MSWCIFYLQSSSYTDSTWSLPVPEAQVQLQTSAQEPLLLRPLPLPRRLGRSLRRAKGLPKRALRLKPFPNCCLRISGIHPAPPKKTETCTKTNGSHARKKKVHRSLLQQTKNADADFGLLSLLRPHGLVSPKSCWHKGAGARWMSVMSALSDRRLWRGHREH